MGNSCSSRQAHKDDASHHSEESPSYQLTLKKPSTDGAAAETIQELSTTAQGHPVAPSSLLGTQGSFRDGSRKGGLNRVFRNVASSSISDSISLSSPVAAQSPRSLDPGTGAPAASGALSALPIEAQAALLGRASEVRQRNRALVLYVCAADSQDCCQEKGLLHVGTANVLRRTARSKGWRLHVSDLHWRSPLEQQRDHRFPILCRAELARQCELACVVPVLFLNSGLGTPLLPHSIDSADFQAALAAVSSEDDRMLLNKWYKLDSAATPPCYRLARGAAARWRREMARALAALVGALPTEARDAYLTTVVEQEVHNTVLMSQEQARRCLWVCRAGGGGGGGASEEPSDLAGNQELQRRLCNLQRDLKQHLSDRHIVRASLRGPRGGPPGSAAGAEYVEGIREALLSRLSASLDSLIADDAGSWPRAANGVPTSLFEELTEQLTFCQKAAQCTANREITLNEIKNYICGDSNIPLVVTGAVGSGKTSLMARTALLCNTWLPEAAVVIRFAGLTADSSSSHAILKSIVDHVSVLSTGVIHRGRNEVVVLKEALTRSLLSLSVGGSTVLMVVGAGRIPHMSWLPTELPNNVKLIISVTEDREDLISSALLKTLSTAGALTCQSVATAAEARATLAACAALYGRSGAPPPPPLATEAVDKCTQPLYAKIIAWQISLSAETFTEQCEPEIEEELKICPDLPGQVEQLLVRSECALGAERVGACLALLTAARRGLEDAEMLDLLANEEMFRSEQTYLPWAPASLFWSQLAALLSPFLFWVSGGRARWRDEAVRRAAVTRYLHTSKSQEKTVRTKLVEYFQGVLFAADDPKMSGRLISQENKFSDECYNRRKLEEIPYQEYHLYKEDLQTYSERPYFTNHQEIYDTIAACGSTQMLDDLSLIKIDPLPEHVVVLKEFLQDNSFALDYDVRQFYGLLRLSLRKRMAESGELESEFCRQWLKVAQNPPIPTLIATNLSGKPSVQADMASLDEAFEPAKCSYDLVVRLEGSCRYAATVSTEREEICVWDVKRSVKVRTLTGVTHPINLVPIDKHKCVVLCRRELRVYDLNKGTFLLTLKGVMNQKMPYYGLHDSEHLVCLSRNRMYVNLMNITTGDCVTTFKAGEDRFLNSLLVSGDGRILVCGDETQKPFPLLIWSLKSRKLLYDLRIAHHDFVTSLAAITHEGSYVCVVARELDEPGPNFIVVYDLQSGTMFKKWKPGCDTVSLAISATDGCVVSGLRDSRILVWDLVTGNCRRTLCGHSSGPTHLRLARDGSVLLSTDSRGYDLSVRLWDLNAGTLIAVYTPPEPITSCEVLGAGDLIALALEGQRELVTLRLEGRVGKPASADEDQLYGDEDMEGAVLDLRDKNGTPAY